MATATLWRLDRRTLLAIGVLALAVVSMTAGWALTRAQSTPPELTMICVHQGSDKLSVAKVDSPSLCNQNNQTFFELPDDGPVNTCAQHNNGQLRYVGSATSCSGGDTFVQLPGPSVTYLCAKNGNGDLRLVSSPSLCSGTETAYMVSPANEGPDALPQSVSVDEDDSIVITLEATDADGDSLTFAITDGPDHGSLGSLGSVSCSGSPSTCTVDVTYTPDANYNGPDSFSFSATDPDSESDTATVSITVNAINDAPTATNKTLEAHTNMPVSISAPGLLGGAADAADTGANPGYTPVFTVSNVSATSPAGGDVSVNADGSFTFTPPPGVTGDVTFTFQVCDNGDGTPASACSADATVTVTVDGPVIWFVDDSAGSGGNGTLASPFDGLDDALSAIGSDTGERIFVYSGSYSSGVALNDGGWLVGQGATGLNFDTLMGITPPAGTAGRPSINGAAPELGDTVTLNSNSVVRGIALDTGANTALADAAGATNNVTVSEVTVSTTSGSGVVLDGLTAGSVFSIDGVTKTGSGGTGVSITGASGSLSFESVNVSGGAGVAVSNSAGATIGFDGLVLDTGANAGFAATNGGTVTVTGTGNSIETTTATALHVEDTTIGAAGLVFESISSNGATNGVVLDSTGSSGGLTVTGNGTVASGGTIRNGGVGISLANTQSPSLSWMQLNDFDDFAIRGTAVAGFSLTNSVINGVNGDDALANEGSVRFTGLTGSATISDTSISGGFRDNVSIVNSSGTLNRITFDGVTLGANSTTDGADGIAIDAQGSAVVNVTVTNSNFTATRANHFRLNLVDSSSTDLQFTGNTVSNNHPSVVSGGGGIRLVGGAIGGNITATYDISGNVMRDSNGTAIGVTKGAGAGTFTGTISGNTIGVAAVANSGSAAGSGVSLISAESGTHTVLISGNDIRQYNNFGILVQAGGTAAVGNGSLNATVVGNTIADPGTALFVKNGFQLNAGTFPGDTYNVCLALGGAGSLANSLASSGTDGGTDFRLRQRQATTVRLPGYLGASDDDAAAVAFVQSNNGVTPTGQASNSVPTGGGWIGGAACATP